MLLLVSCLEFILFEVILSTLTSDVPVVDGMDRTMMITGQTGHACAVVLPYRNPIRIPGSHADVTDRTAFCAQSAMDALSGFNCEFLVIDQKSLEKSSDDMGKDPWHVPLDDSAKACLAVLYPLSEILDVGKGTLFFVSFLLWEVDVHKRKADITLWHYQRDGIIGRQSHFL